uniref:Uncharacterized protein n=1 Tax=Solanum lycopersicum TaxID=4081 RepID=K4D0B8_SOLLC
MKCSMYNTFEYNKKGCPTLKNVTAGTNTGTSNIVVGISAATIENAAISYFTYIDAAIESHSSVSVGLSADCTPSASCTTCAGPKAVSRAGLSAGYTPSAAPSASCIPCVGSSAGPKAVSRVCPSAGPRVGSNACCTPNAGCLHPYVTQKIIN